MESFLKLRTSISLLVTLHWPRKTCMAKSKSNINRTGKYACLAFKHFQVM